MTDPVRVVWRALFAGLLLPPAIGAVSSAIVFSFTDPAGAAGYLSPVFVARRHEEAERIVAGRVAPRGDHLAEVVAQRVPRAQPLAVGRPAPADAQERRRSLRELVVQLAELGEAQVPLEAEHEPRHDLERELPVALVHRGAAVAAPARRVRLGGRLHQVEIGLHGALVEGRHHQLAIARVDGAVLEEEAVAEHLAHHRVAHGVREVLALREQELPVRLGPEERDEVHAEQARAEHRSVLAVPAQEVFAGMREERPRLAEPRNGGQRRNVADRPRVGESMCLHQHSGLAEHGDKP